VFWHKNLQMVGTLNAITNAFNQPIWDGSRDFIRPRLSPHQLALVFLLALVL
jgi:hypothetical protein